MLKNRISTVWFRMGGWSGVGVEWCLCGCGFGYINPSWNWQPACYTGCPQDPTHNTKQQLTIFTAVPNTHNTRCTHTHTLLQISPSTFTKMDWSYSIAYNTPIHDFRCPLQPHSCSIFEIFNEMLFARHFRVNWSYSFHCYHISTIMEGFWSKCYQSCLRCLK